MKKIFSIAISCVILATSMCQMVFGAEKTPYINILTQPTWNNYTGFSTDGQMMVSDNTGTYFINTNGDQVTTKVNNITLDNSTLYGNESIIHYTNKDNTVNFFYRSNGKSMDPLNNMLNIYNHKYIVDKNFSSSLLAVSEKGFSFLVDNGGNTYSFPNKRFMRVDYGNRYKFAFVGDASENLISFSITNNRDVKDTTNNKYGFITKLGKIAISPKFQAVGDFIDGYAPVEINDKWGIIDTKGNFIVKPIYDAYTNNTTFHGAKTPYFINGLTIMQRRDKYVTVDINGEELFSNNYNNVYGYSDGLALITDKNGLYGYVDEYNSTVIKPMFTHASNFSNGTALVKDYGKYYLINENNEIISDASWDFQNIAVIRNYPNLIMYEKNNKWGLAEITSTSKEDLLLNKLSEKIPTINETNTNTNSN